MGLRETAPGFPQDPPNHMATVLPRISDLLATSHRVDAFLCLYGQVFLKQSELPSGKRLSDIFVERLGKQFPSSLPESLCPVDPPEITVRGYALTLEDARFELRQINFWT